MEGRPTESLIQTDPVTEIAVADWLPGDEAARRHLSMGAVTSTSRSGGNWRPGDSELRWASAPRLCVPQ